MRLPALGPRGEGWFLGQLVFIIAVAVAPPAQWPAGVSDLARPLGGLLVGGGLVVGALGLLALGGNLTPLPKPRARGELVESGIYGVIRHPIYAGLVLFAVGWSLWRASVVGLALSVGLAVFLDLKARREEQFLAEAFPGYAAYRGRTRRFIPGLY